ncbi:MAG TPA: regulatory protein RecX [Candidatus Saccharimonadales bacterium]|nr:regulatory protein RecX [Candidatus Saccharimonadales bacterium]
MDFDSLYLRVLKYLGYRPRSEKEIRDYLAKKTANILNFDVQLIDLIIHKLKQQRFLNDREFARMWVHSRTSFKPKGRRIIAMELKQKGISPELIEEALLSPEEALPTDLENATEVLEKKRKKYEGMERQERFNKAGSMLARRGYDLDTIRKAIDLVFGK